MRPLARSHHHDAPLVDPSKIGIRATNADRFWNSPCTGPLALGHGRHQLAANGEGDFNRAIEDGHTMCSATWPTSKTNSPDSYSLTSPWSASQTS